MCNDKDKNRSLFLNKTEKLILEELKSFSIPKGLSIKTAWEKLEGKILESDKKSYKTTSLWPKLRMAIAASVLLMIAFYVVFKTTSEKYVNTTNGENLVYYLPDNTKVTLNASSSIRYNRWSWQWQREVEIDGEAFFDVTRGNTFKVVSKNGLTEVLGTSFNVFNRGTEYRVACLTGKVKVKSSDNKDFHVLTPGLQASYDKGITQGPKSIAVEKINNWIMGEFDFEEVPLIKVFKEIERQYNVTVIFPDSIEKMIYTGSFSKGDIYKSIEKVCLPMGLQYDIKNHNKIVVSRRKP